MIRRPTRSKLFPYTTLFRSGVIIRMRSAIDLRKEIESKIELAGTLVRIQPAENRNDFVFDDFRIGYLHRAGNVDRKSTRLNSSHSQISYAVFCLKKKNRTKHDYNATANMTVIRAVTLFFRTACVRDNFKRTDFFYSTC